MKTQKMAKTQIVFAIQIQKKKQNIYWNVMIDLGIWQKEITKIEEYPHNKYYSV